MPFQKVSKSVQMVTQCSIHYYVYLIALFVTDWSGLSPCSRTCGPGVKVHVCSDDYSQEDCVTATGKQPPAEKCQLEECPRDGKGMFIHYNPNKLGFIIIT